MVSTPPPPPPPTCLLIHLESLFSSMLALRQIEQNFTMYVKKPNVLMIASILHIFILIVKLNLQF